MKPTFTHLVRLFVFFLFLNSLGLYAQIGSGIAPVNSPSGGFNIDGTLISNSSNGDWLDGTGTGGYVLANSGTPINTKTTYHLYDEYNSLTDNIFGGGDKVSDNPNNMTWVTSTANNKTDMNNALIHFTTDANGNVWFVFAADRLSNSGNAYIDFEFLQNELTKTATGFATTASNSTGGRTEGDFLLTVYFESGVAKFDIQRWSLVSGVWQYKTYYSSLPVNSVYAAGNTTSIPVLFSAFGTNTYPQNTFIESAVNLTEVLGTIDPCANLKIKTIFVKSKTSTSPSSSIKDFFDPLAVSNLTLGSADAGDDDTVCSGGSYQLKGVAVPSPNYSVVSTTWSVINGSATIANPSQLNSYVTITGSSATLRLTVETHPTNGVGTHCIVYDDVIITSVPSPNCSITGAEGPICPSTTNSYSAPSGTTYLWSISGNATISGSTTSQTVNVVSGQNCNQSYTLSLETTNASGCTITCSKTISVIDTTAPVLVTTSGALNHTIECSNTVAIAAALTEVPTATDNCSATPTIHLVSDVTTADSNCANAYSRVRTWNFTDACGNTSNNFVQTISVNDTTAPVLVTTSGELNHTIECSNTAAIDAALTEVPTATDNCSASPTLHLVSDVTTADSNCANAYSRVRTWNFTDACGNTSNNFVQTISVTDTTAPVLVTTSGALNHTIECSNTVAIAAALTEVPTATDNCSTTPTLHLVSDVTTADNNCANAYSRVRTWNFTDACGNTSSNFVQTISVIDTSAPTWTTLAESLDSTIECSDVQTLANAQKLFPIATDNCDTNVSNIIKVAGTFVASQTCANAGTYTNTWTVTDDCGNISETFTQVINVIDTSAPTFKAPADITITSDANCQADIRTSITGEVTQIQDNCDPNPTASFTDSDCFGNFNAASVNSGTGNYFPITISGFDNVSANTIKKLALSFETNQGKGNAEFILVAPNGQGVVLVAPYCNGGDCDNPTPNQKEVYLTEFYPASSNFPKWNNNDPIATNSIQNFTPNGALSTINSISGLNSLVSSFEELTGSMNGNWFVYARKDGTQIGEIKFNSACLTPGSTSCANDKVIFRKWTVSDACANAVSFNQIIKIVDTTAPTWTTVAGSLNTSVECSDAQALANAQKLFPIATDNCDANVSNIVKVAGTFVASESCANAGTYTNTWTVTDACGNSSEPFTQVINVIDTTAPTWTTLAGSLNTSIECSDAQALENAQKLFPIATDNCDANVTNIVKIAGTFVASESCANAGTYTNTWTVTDDCGNISETFTQVINVIDTTAPTWTTVAGSLNTSIQCNDAQALANAQKLFPIANDNCDTNVTNIVKVAGTFVASESCANAGTYTNTWTVTDACGNISEPFTQVINVIDTTAPTWTTVAGSLNTSIECSDAQALANAQKLFPIANDNCDTNVNNIVKVAGTFVASQTCANAGTYTNTWTVTDDCGNISEPFTQVINVIDTTAPTWTTVAGSLNTSIECSDTQALANAQKLFPIANDNCDTNVTNIVKVAGTFVASESCANAGTYTNTWTVTDACGNISQPFTQIINVIDTTAPTWTTKANTLNTTIECSDTQALTNAQKLFPIATDNCDTNVSNIVKVAGTFVASESCANAGTYTNTWTVTDACGNISEPFTQVITIQDTTDPILLTQAADKIVECDGQGNKEAIANWLATNGGATASDNCSEIHWSNNFERLPKDCSSKITVKFTATDNCGNKTTTSATFSVQDTTPPVVPEAPTNITVTCSSDIPPMISLTAKDNCSGDLTVEGTNNIKKGDCKNSYVITRTWTFRDDCNNIATTSQTITIEDNIAPVITSLPEPTTISCAGTPQFAQPTAADECGYNKVSLTFNDVKTEGNCAGSYSITRTWIATDACGNSSTASQTIAVEDKIAPVIANLPAPTTISCPNTPVFAFASATDECGSDFSLTFNDVRTEGNCVGSYSITRTWTATDTCGNSSTASQTIAVEDKTAPVIAKLPATKTINYPNTPEFVQATATDECSPNLDLTFKDVRTDGNTINSYSITRTWTAIDACGNSATASQTINVENKTGAITTSEFNADIVATCDAIPAKPELVFTSPCPTATPVIFTETISNQTANSYTINRKWVATDICGNTSEFIQTVNITISNALTMVTGTVCNDGETTSIDLASLLPIGTPTNGAWTDVSNSGKLVGTIFNAATLAVGDYIFEYTINDLNCPRKIQITITVRTDCDGIVLPCGTIIVHNTFSPNGDGINDKFVIDNINDTNCYPDNTVEIYNRWGVLVYSTKGYNNTTNAFDGVSNSRSVLSQSSGVPTGTYFYILTYTSFDNNNTVQTNKKEGYLFLTK